VVSEGYVQAFFHPSKPTPGLPETPALAERLRKGLFLRIHHLLKRSNPCAPPCHQSGSSLKKFVIPTEAERSGEIYSSSDLDPKPTS
jgi:hypothetical protein